MPSPAFWHQWDDNVVPPTIRQLTPHNFSIRPLNSRWSEYVFPYLLHLTSGSQIEAFACIEFVLLCVVMLQIKQQWENWSCRGGKRERISYVIPLNTSLQFCERLSSFFTDIKWCLHLLEWKLPTTLWGQKTINSVSSKYFASLFTDN